MDKELIRGEFNHLVELLASKAECLEEMIELTNQQKVELERPQETHFHELGQRKQQCGGKIQVIDQEFMEKYGSLRELMITQSTIYPIEIKKIQQLILGITDLMQQLYLTEKQIKEQMQKQMRQVHKQMRKVQHGPDYVANIYKKQPPKRP